MLVSEKAAILLQCFCSFLSGESKLRLWSVGCRTFRWIQKLQDPHGAGSRHRRHVADEFELPEEKNSGKHHVEVRAHDNQQVNTFTKEEFVWRKWEGFNGCCCYGSVSWKHTSACAKPGPNQGGKHSCLHFESIYASSRWTSLEHSWYLFLWRFSMNGVRSKWTNHKNAIMLKRWEHLS